MNIQIFGSKKSQDSKKAERYFKERRINFQYIDMKEKGLSYGEFTSVIKAVGGVDALLDEKCKDQDAIALIRYTAEEYRQDELFDHQDVIKLPIVRNGRQATVGYCPDIWKTWE